MNVLNMWSALVLFSWLGNFFYYMQSADYMTDNENRMCWIWFGLNVVNTTALAGVLS